MAADGEGAVAVVGAFVDLDLIAVVEIHRRNFVEVGASGPQLVDDGLAQACLGWSSTSTRLRRPQRSGYLRSRKVMAACQLSFMCFCIMATARTSASLSAPLTACRNRA